MANEYVTEIAFTPRLMASVCGLDGSGKTDFACGMPGHIAFFSIDPNSRETAEQAQTERGAQIEFHEFSLPGIAFGGRDEVQDDAIRVWDAFIDAVAPLVRRERKRGHPDSIAIDTGTEFFELLLLADHGKSVQILPELRTKTNARWKSLLRGLKDSGCHVAVLHRLRQKYETQTVRGPKGTVEERVPVPGVYERQGFNQTGFSVNVEVFLSFDAERAEGDQYGMTIERCTSRPALIGREVWGTTAKGERRVSWAKLQRLVYPARTS